MNLGGEPEFSAAVFFYRGDFYDWIKLNASFWLEIWGPHASVSP
jgi:hypothetical protein